MRGFRLRAHRSGRRGSLTTPEVRPSKSSSRRRGEQGCEHTNVFLGRPSVGGRLTAGATRSEARILRGRSVLVIATAEQVLAQSLLGSRHLIGGRCGSRLALGLSQAQVQAAQFVPHAALRSTAAPSLRVVRAPASTPAHVASRRSGCQNASHASPQASNPSIERTFQRPLRALWPAAHVKR